MRLQDAVEALDGYFSVADVSGDFPWYAEIEPYWRDYVEPGYEERWNGLMVRGTSEVERAVTCVFPSHAIVSSLPPRTLLFSEHPVDFADEPGFLFFERETFEAMHERGIAFYHVHAPIDHHPEVSPSRLCATGVGLQDLDEFLPIADGIDGGAIVAGDSPLTVQELAGAFRAYLGTDIPVQVVAEEREVAGRVAVAAGGGAEREALRAALDRGCQTYVTGNAATRCRIPFVQESVRDFRALAGEADVSLIDATHYGMERPPQLAMLAWFERLGLPAEFAENGPK